MKNVSKKLIFKSKINNLKNYKANILNLTRIADKALGLKNLEAEVTDQTTVIIDNALGLNHMVKWDLGHPREIIIEITLWNKFIVQLTKLTGSKQIALMKMFQVIKPIAKSSQ